MTFWLVTRQGTHDQHVQQVAVHLICTAGSREMAKKKAASFLGGNPEEYVCSPLTGLHDKVHIELSYPIVWWEA